MLASLRHGVGRVARRARGMSSYTERMDKTGRPVSPAITIYNFPPIAWSSVTVRGTGVLLTFGTWGIAGLSLVAGPDAPAEFAQTLASSAIAPLAKFSVAFPLTYHFLGACRHAFWDLTAKGFSNPTMRASSYALFGVSGLLSVALAAYTQPPSEKAK